MKTEWIISRRKRLQHVWVCLRIEGEETSSRGFDINYEPAKTAVLKLAADFEKIINAEYKEFLPPPKEKRKFRKPEQEEQSDADTGSTD